MRLSLDLNLCDQQLAVRVPLRGETTGELVCRMRPNWNKYSEKAEELE